MEFHGIHWTSMNTELKLGGERKERGGRRIRS